MQVSKICARSIPVHVCSDDVWKPKSMSGLSNRNWSICNQIASGSFSVSSVQFAVCKAIWSCKPPLKRRFKMAGNGKRKRKVQADSLTEHFRPKNSIPAQHHEWLLLFQQNYTHHCVHAVNIECVCAVFVWSRLNTKQNGWNLIHKTGGMKEVATKWNQDRKMNQTHSLKEWNAGSL